MDPTAKMVERAAEALADHLHPNESIADYSELLQICKEEAWICLEAALDELVMVGKPSDVRAAFSGPDIWRVDIRVYTGGDINSAALANGHICVMPETEHSVGARQ